jgi:hypothetical protein
MNYVLYVAAPCFVLAALFYGWLKFLNWRQSRTWKKMANLDILRRGWVLLALLLPLTGCKDMTPAERAALTSFALDTATMARDKKFGPKAPKAGKMSGKAVAPTVPPKGTEKLFE